MIKPIPADEARKLMERKIDALITALNEKITLAAQADKDYIVLTYSEFNLVKSYFTAAGYNCTPESGDQLAMISWR